MARLEGYVVVKKVARGGMAEVFLARPPPSRSDDVGEWVAVKQLIPDLESKDEFVDMFVEEGKLALLLRHPNVVRTLEVGVLDGRHTIVMELLQGNDLRKLSRAARRTGIDVPMDVAVVVAMDVCAGLHAAHEARGPDGRKLYVVHRDVSPQNVFVGDDGTSKIVDFGIAKSDLRGYETQGGMLKGKVPYMAPEQIKCEALDRRADVYAVGVTLYESLLGEKPYAAANGTEFALMLAIAKHDVVAPRVRRPSLPVELERIVLKALAFAPADRYPTCDDLRDDLAAFALRERLERESVVRWSRAVVDAVRSAREPFAAEKQAIGAPATIDAPPRADDHDGPRIFGAHAAVAAIERIGTVSVVRFEGRIDERFQGRELGEALSGKLLFDLAMVERVSSYGVRGWLEMMAALDPSTEVYFFRCSEAVVAQLGTSSAFAGRARVVSFLVPIVCEDCGASSTASLDVEHHRAELLAEIVRPRPCERCAGACRLDDAPSILGFARRHVGSPVPAPVRAVVARLDRRHESGIGDTLEKVVTAEETRVVLRRPPKRPVRWSRALDGVEGKLVLDFRGDARLDGANVAALLAALGALGDEVAEIEIYDAPLSLARILVGEDGSARARPRLVSVAIEGQCRHCDAPRIGRLDAAGFRGSFARADVRVECRRCGAPLALAAREAAERTEPSAVPVIVGEPHTPPQAREAGDARRAPGAAVLALVVVLVLVVVALAVAVTEGVTRRRSVHVPRRFETTTSASVSHLGRET